MSHYVITPPEGLPVTLEQAKAQCRVDIDIEDALVERLIRSAWQHAEHYQQRTLLTCELGMTLHSFSSHESTRHGFSTDCFLPNGLIQLPYPPLQSITSITYIDPNGQEQTLDPSAYEFEFNPGKGVIYPAYGHHWPATRCYRNSVTIRWIAGYDECPIETQSAILLMVGHLFEHREAVTEGTLIEVPMAVKDLLNVNCWGNYS